jgi:hypothetical protein
MHTFGNNRLALSFAAREIPSYSKRLFRLLSHAVNSWRVINKASISSHLHPDERRSLSENNTNSKQPAVLLGSQDILVSGATMISFQSTCPNTTGAGLN